MLSCSDMRILFSDLCFKKLAQVITKIISSQQLLNVFLAAECFNCDKQLLIKMRYLSTRLYTCQQVSVRFSRHTSKELFMTRSKCNKILQKSLLGMQSCI